MARSADEEAVQGISDKKARKEAYYTRQRQNAKMGSAEKGKIEGKLNFGDEARGFAKDQYQKVMASGPWSIPGGKAAEAVEGAVGGAAKAIGSGARGLAKRAGSAIESEVQHLRKPTPVQKALGSRKPALRSAKSQSRSMSPTEKASAKAVSGKAPKAMSGTRRNWLDKVLKRCLRPQKRSTGTVQREQKVGRSQLVTLSLSARV